MTWSRIFMTCAAFTVVSATVAVAQGRGAAQRPPKAAVAQGPKQTGKTARVPANRPADRPVRPERPAERADRPERGADADARGNGNNPREDQAQGRGQLTVAERISANPELKTRLEAMLPSGMTLADAADGFRNQGQFIAALQASKEGNISFAALKTEMTGENQLSLGQAIEKLKATPSTTTTP
jgi:hypothetical protein